MTKIVNSRPEQSHQRFSGNGATGVLTVWHVSLQDAAQRLVQKIIPIGLDDQGKRSKAIENMRLSQGS